MAMNKSEQQMFDRALDVAKRYEQENRKFRDLQQYINLRLKILSVSKSDNTNETTVLQEILNFLEP